MEAALRRSKPTQEARASLVVQVCDVGARLSDKILRRLGEVGETTLLHLCQSFEREFGNHGARATRYRKRGCNDVDTCGRKVVYFYFLVC